MLRTSEARGRYLKHFAGPPRLLAKALSSAFLSVQGQKTDDLAAYFCLDLAWEFALNVGFVLRLCPKKVSLPLALATENRDGSTTSRSSRLSDGERKPTETPTHWH